MNKATNAAAGFYDADLCKLADFEALISRSTRAAEVPQAATVEKNVPIYDIAKLGGTLSEPVARRALMAEWAQVLLHGAGVFVLKRACRDLGAIDAATAVYEEIIAEEKDHGTAADHFAAAGSNDRVWNSLQKLCERAPDVFVRYFAVPAIDAASEAWLGPNYQMTAQVNLVHPGGKAQQAHRDYHLGFQTAEACATYPAHVHELSPLMTLQGGIAHCDMPVESGPTKLLPYSQLYKPGYAAWRREDFRALFEARHVQLPLEKGDAIFFNPALFHAAGANESADIHRLVNLLQISSAFGRALESIDRVRMCARAYPAFAAARAAGTLSGAELDAAIAATAEGYPFPTNLDTDPPVGGLAPKSQATLMRDALEAGLPAEDFVAALAVQEARRPA